MITACCKSPVLKVKGNKVLVEKLGLRRTPADLVYALEGWGRFQKSSWTRSGAPVYEAYGLVLP